MDRSSARTRPFRSALRPLSLGLLLLGCALSLAASAAGVYVWYDKDGRPHYTDRPQPGAQEVAVTPAQTYEAPKPPAGNTFVAQSAPSPAPAAPGCRIVSPVADEVFLNVPSITVTAIGPTSGTPTLQLNGASIPSPDGKPSFTITPIPRGSYTAVVIFDGGANSAPLCRTAPVVFHVRQPSVIRPAAPKPAPSPAARP
jgi:hypothetical protein